jgi:hypothetical protein
MDTPPKETPRVNKTPGPKEIPLIIISLFGVREPFGSS